MAYLGPPPSQKLATPTSQYFSGNGSATAFTLNRPVNVAEDLNVFVNNVAQQPGAGKSYTATGTTLTFDAAPDAGTNNVYVVYRGLSEGTLRLEQDPNSGITATTGTFSGAFTSPGIDDNADATAITISSGELVGIGETSPTSALHIKGGAGTNLAIQSTAGTHWRIGDGVGSTNGNLVIYDYTDSRKVFEIDTLGRVTMPNQIAFRAYAAPQTTQAQSTLVWSATATNIGSHYNTSNGRFTVPVAGSYLFSISMLYPASGSYARLLLAINGQTSTQIADTLTSVSGSYQSSNATAIITLSVNDYVTVVNSGPITTYGTGYGSFCGHLIG
jgi:hypothetical protein